MISYWTFSKQGVDQSSGVNNSITGSRDVWEEFLLIKIHTHEYIQRQKRGINTKDKGKFEW